MGLITQQLNSLDQANLRLSCRHCFSAQRASEHTRKVAIAAAGPFTFSITAVKLLSPHSLVTLHTHLDKEGSQLCQLANCHAVRLTIRASDFCLWQADPDVLQPKPQKRLMHKALQHALSALGAASTKEKLELAVCITAGATPKEVSSVSAALNVLRASVVHIRFTKTPHAVMAGLFPFANLQILEIALPKKGDKTLTETAMQNLPLLRALHVYSHGNLKAGLVPSSTYCMDYQRSPP